MCTEGWWVFQPLPATCPFSLACCFPNKILALLNLSLQLLFKLTHPLPSLPAFVPASPEASPHKHPRAVKNGYNIITLYIHLQCLPLKENKSQCLPQTMKSTSLTPHPSSLLPVHQFPCWTLFLFPWTKQTPTSKPLPGIQSPCPLQGWLLPVMWVSAQMTQLQGGSHTATPQPLPPSHFSMGLAAIWNGMVYLFTVCFPYKLSTPWGQGPRLIFLMEWFLTSPSMLLIRTSSLRISKAPWIRSSRFMPFSLAKVSSNPFSASSNVCYVDTQNALTPQCPKL